MSFTDWSLRRLSRWSKFAGLLVAAGALAACASGNRTDPINADLVEVDRGNFDYVFMLPDRPLTRVTRIHVAEPEVEMSDYWLRDHRHDYTERDLDRIKTTYARLLSETLSETLAAQSQVDLVEPDEAEIIVRPKLRRLNIYAPDLSATGRRDNYVEAAGNGTLDLEFVDARSNEVVAQFIDHRETPAIVPGRLEETNRATNHRMFRRLMERWSNNLVEYLDRQAIVPRR